MARIAQPRPAVPVAYRPVDPLAALALAVVVLGLGALIAGIGSWDLQFDASYWMDMVAGLMGDWLDLGLPVVVGMLSQFAEAAYSALTDSMPVLMAALLLALFALGPSEIMSAVGARSRES